MTYLVKIKLAKTVVNQVQVEADSEYSAIVEAKLLTPFLADKAQYIATLNN